MASRRQTEAAEGKRLEGETACVGGKGKKKKAVNYLVLMLDQTIGLISAQVGSEPWSDLRKREGDDTQKLLPASRCDRGL